MVVITLSKVSKSLKGDLSRWLIEISTGTFVGNLNPRVRDQLWERVCQLTKSGKATMVYTAQCEQKLKFRVHGTDWEPVDYDGLVLMKKPNGNIDKSAKVKDNKPTKVVEKTPGYPNTFVVLDCETTGLDPDINSLLEIGALKVENNIVTDQYQALIKQPTKLSDFIRKLTGLNDKAVDESGIPCIEAINGLISFTSGFPIVGYNIDFDLDFIKAESSRLDIEFSVHDVIDALQMAKEKLAFLPNRKLVTVASHYDIKIPVIHRALADCFTTLSVFQKLKEN